MSPLTSGRYGVPLAILLLSVASVPLPALGDGFTKAEFYVSNGSSADGGYLGRNSVGVEGLHKIAGENGDRATVAYQARLSRYRALDMDNRVLMSADDWEPEIHTAYVNLRGFFGRMNLKAGHLEVPFGLEPVVDTHTTLVPSASMVNLGTMNDWGASLNGQLRPFDYEVALTTGAGMKARWNPLERDDGTYLVAARIQPVTDGNVRYGIAALFGTMSPLSHPVAEMALSTGHAAEPMAEPLREERRVGFDYRNVVFAFSKALDVRLETAVGTRNGVRVVSFDGSLAHEFDSGWKWIAGTRLWSEGDMTRDVWATASLRKQFAPGLAVEAFASRDLSRKTGALDTSFLTLLYITR